MSPYGSGAITVSPGRSQLSFPDRRIPSGVWRKARGPAMKRTKRKSTHVPTTRCPSSWTARLAQTPIAEPRRTACQDAEALTGKERDDDEGDAEDERKRKRLGPGFCDREESAQDSFHGIAYGQVGRSRLKTSLTAT